MAVAECVHLPFLLDGHVFYFISSDPAALPSTTPPIIDEIQAGSNAGAPGQLKQRCIDAWLRHGTHAYYESDIGDAHRSKKRRRKTAAHHADDVAVAKKKQEDSTKPKFAISWFTQAVLSHRAFWQAFTNYIQVIPMAQHDFLVALIVGFVWWQTPYLQSAVPELLGVAYFIAIYTGGLVPLLESIFNCSYNFLPCFFFFFFFFFCSQVAPFVLQFHKSEL